MTLLAFSSHRRQRRENLSKNFLKWNEMASIFCFLNQFFFMGRREGGEGELQQRSVLLSTTHCTSHVCYTVAPCIRESKTVLDSAFHAVDSWFQVLDSSLFLWNLDSGFQSLVGFRIPWAVFGIPDSTSKNLSDSPTWGDICVTRRNLV